MHRPLSQLAAIALIPYAWLTWSLWFVCDDAYISFRFAKNAALGHGLRYNLGDHVPVEGYSNFLWTLIAAGVERLGLDPTVSMPALSALTGAALIVHVMWAARTLGLHDKSVVFAGLLLSCSPIVATWATGGLATMPAAWALFAVFERLTLGRTRRAMWAACTAAAALSLLRTEGPAWVIVVCILAFVQNVHARREHPWRAPALVLGLASIVVSAHLAWRYGYYGDLVSNTARAKVSLSWERLMRGVTYVGGTWLALLSPAIMLLTTPTALYRTGARSVAIVAMAWGVPLWCVVVGGDYMAFGRLLLAGLPFAALTAALSFDRGLAQHRPTSLVAAGTILVLGALPAWDLGVTPTAVTDSVFFRHTTPYIRSERQMWEFMSDNAKRWTIQGQALGQLDPGTLVTGAIGARGYYSDQFIYDRGGLVTAGLSNDASRQHSTSPGHDIQAPRSVFLSRDPTWMRFKLFLSSVPPSKVIKQLAAWRVPTSWRSRYAPTLVPVVVEGHDYVLMLLQRVDTPNEASATWGRFEGLVHQTFQMTP